MPSEGFPPAARAAGTPAPRKSPEITAVDPRYFAAARAGVLERPPMSALRATYHDEFNRATTAEYSAFKALPFPAEERAAITRRVHVAICRIWAFQAWYAVVWRIVDAGYALAPIVGLLVALVALVLVIGFVREAAGFALGWIIPLAALAGAWVSSSMIPRSWPANAIVLVVCAGVAWTVSQLAFVTHLGASWGPGAAAAAAGLVAFAVTLLAALVVAQALHRWATVAKITRFPADEIVESITALLVQFVTKDKGWKKLTFRREIVQQLEWIARRFEIEYAGTFTGDDATSDPMLRADAAAYAAGFRTWKRTLAFPAEGTPDAFRMFMWQALRATASDRWSDLPHVTEAVAPASRRERVATQVRNVATIGGPVAIAVALLFVPTKDPSFITVRSNLLITMGLWSAFSLLAMINPKQFDTQASAAKILGGLVTKV